MTTDDLKIDVKTLSGWLSEKKPVTILDVRPKQEREEWSIPESVHADVFDELKANNPGVLDSINLPNNMPVVTVCAGGKTSLIAAGYLNQNGFDAYSLEGGMKAWNYAWNTAEMIFSDELKIIQVRRSAKGCLSYIVGSKNEAIVIDASLDPNEYVQLANNNGWEIRYVMDTHIHADYISRTRELAEASGATHFMINKAKVDFSYVPVKDADVIKFGNSFLEIIHSPGHTWESTSFRIADKAIFTGDTLFIDGVGRPDLKADREETIEKSKQLHHSLMSMISLPSSILVFPAHTSKAVPFDDKLITETIGRLKDKLDLLKFTEEAFIQYTLLRIPPTPPNYLTIAKLNKQGSYKGYQPSDLEAGANHCAIS